MKKKVLLLGCNSFVRQSIISGLGDSYQIIPAAGHHAPKNGYQLLAEEPNKLLEILAYENPEIIISSIRGDYQSQMNFHKALADWLSGKRIRLLYISTANVFDGNSSKPWTEHDPPVPESDYGSFKRDCETMLGNILENQLLLTNNKAENQPLLKRLVPCFSIQSLLPKQSPVPSSPQPPSGSPRYSHRQRNLPLFRTSWKPRPDCGRYLP